MKIFIKTIVIIMLTLFIEVSAWGDQSDLNYRRCGDQQWELSFGIGENHRIPKHTLVPHLDFNVTKLEYEKFISQRTSIGGELCLANLTDNVDSNAASMSANYTRYFLLHDKFAIDCKFGLGVMHLQDKIRGQASRNNFDEHLGLGLQYALNSNSNISLDYTFYHASNAGIERPNHGINATVVTIGYYWRR